VELLAALHERGVRVLVPLTLPDRDLDWAEWTPEGSGSPLGVEAIGAADLMLVPALAAGADGMRLGRGGGSYDRALTRVRADTQVAALLYDDELRAAVPSEPWDLPVGWAVTPEGWRELEGNTGTEPRG
jgi:5-formyltetrahydrofolate cyclo-ligase